MSTTYNLYLSLRLHLFFLLKDQKINLTIWAEIVFLSHTIKASVVTSFFVVLNFFMFSCQEAFTLKTKPRTHARKLEITMSKVGLWRQN